MLIRYDTTENGKQQRVAEIYTKDEHRINNNAIDGDALKILRKLKSKGFQAYIVGGAVRDLLLGITPKDFDIVTDAYPRKIRKLFWNSRVIGKRFRLVHIHHGDKIIEVSTFRAAQTEVNNVYGKIAEDARRRDFGINALYYCPYKEHLLDYTGGFQDFKNRLVRSLISPEISFKEDPVRMIRAVKYRCITGFRLSPQIQSAIRKQRDGLSSCSSSRLTEEIFKILQTGKSEKIFFDLYKSGLLASILPECVRLMDKNGTSGKGPGKKKYFLGLQHLDQKVCRDKEKGKDTLLAGLVDGLIDDLPWSIPEQKEIKEFLFDEIKRIIQPITPPNKDVESACRILIKAKTSGQ